LTPLLGFKKSLSTTAPLVSGQDYEAMAMQREMSLALKWDLLFSLLANIHDKY